MSQRWVSMERWFNIQNVTNIEIHSIIKNGFVNYLELLSLIKF